MDKYTKPNLKRCAVITVDTQNDFSGAGAIAEIKGTNEIIPQMELILAACRKSRIPIVHFIRIYKEDGSNVDNCRRKLIESGTKIVKPNSIGADLVNSIKPKDSRKLNYELLLGGEIQLIGNLEWVMYKSRWGVFYQTRLEDFLKIKNIDTLIFIGCNFPNCPRTSIYEASERNFKVGMVKDAISGVYKKGIEEMKNIGVKVYTTNRLIQEIEGVSINELNSS